MPMDLATSIVGMTVKGRDNTLQIKGDHAAAQTTPCQCRDEGTHNIVTEPYIRTILVK